MDLHARQRSSRPDAPGRCGSRTKTEPDSATPTPLPSSVLVIDQPRHGRVAVLRSPAIPAGESFCGECLQYLLEFSYSRVLRDCSPCRFGVKSMRTRGGTLSEQLDNDNRVREIFQRVLNRRGLKT